MLERGDVAAGILLTRAVTECAALIWRLRDLIERRHALSAEELDKTFMRMLNGWKNDRTFPEAINVLTLIDHLNAVIPGVRSSYDHLSEFAHPNWCGVAGLFSTIDHEQFTTHFGRKRSAENRANAIRLLCASLGLFEHAYNGIADAMPAYLEELTPL